MAASDGTSGGTDSRRSVQTASTTESPASAVKTTSRPTSTAAAPTTGPSSAPKTAAPMAVPITSPRRPLGVAASSQAKAPAHVKPLPTPCRKRAPASGQKPWANAKPRLARPMSARPTRTARRGTESGGGGSARQSADERPGRVGGDEDADPCLREVERVLEVGEQRRERRVEQRVHPDERADEEQEAAHCHAA